MKNNTGTAVKNKDKIASAAFVLSLKKGFDNVSIKEIQKESGIAASSIYYHFESKNEILAYVVDTYLMESFYRFKKVIKDFNGNFMEKMEFLLNYKAKSLFKAEETFLDDKYQFSHKEYFTLIASIYHQHPEMRPICYKIHDSLYDLYYELIQDAIEKKEIRNDIDIESLIMFIQTIIKGYIFLWIYQPKFSSKKLLDANLKLIREALEKE